MFKKWGHSGASNPDGFRSNIAHLNASRDNVENCPPKENLECISWPMTSFLIGKKTTYVIHFISHWQETQPTNFNFLCRTWRSFCGWRRSGDITMMLQAAIEITCHDHPTTAWVGRCHILLRYLVFVIVVRFLFIRWFPGTRHSIIFWGFPHVMVRVPLHSANIHFSK